MADEYLTEDEVEALRVDEPEDSQDEYLTEEEVQELLPSAGESIGRGAAQGASLGFGDEISPVVEKGLAWVKAHAPSWVKKALYVTPLAVPAIAADQFLPEMSKEEYGETYGKKGYKDLRDEYRGENKAAKEAHPYLYGGSEIVASLPAMIATTGKAKSIKALSGISAAQSAIMSGGLSEEETLTGIAKDMGWGGIFGGVFGAIVPMAGRAAVGVWKKIFGEATEKVIAEGVDAADDAIAKKIVKEVANEDAAEATTKETFEEIIPESKVTKPTSVANPPIQETDVVLAEMGTKDKNVVAYARNRGGKKVIEKSPSLDSNADDNMRVRFLSAKDRIEGKLAVYEKDAGKLVEDSGIELLYEDIADIYQKEINRVANMGEAFTDSGQKALNALDRNFKRFMRKVGKGKGAKWVLKEGSLDAQGIRSFLQGLRKGNKAYFAKIAQGQATSTEQVAMQNISTKVDDILKTGIEGYAEVMEPYSKTLTAYLDVEKSFHRQTSADFFQTKIVKPVQDLLYGTRSVADDKWAQTLLKFGEAADEDIIGAVKDRIALGHLFPEAVTAAESTTFTQQMSQTFHTAAKMGVNPTGAAMDIAKQKIPEAARGFKQWKFKKTFEKEVKKTFSGTKKPTIKSKYKSKRITKDQLRQAVKKEIKKSKARKTIKSTAFEASKAGSVYGLMEE